MWAWWPAMSPEKNIQKNQGNDPNSTNDGTIDKDETLSAKEKQRKKVLSSLTVRHWSVQSLVRHPFHASHHVPKCN